MKITLKLGLFAILFGLTLIAHSQTNDSIVQITADAQGLQLMTPDELPSSGTFWVAGSCGMPVPMPCLFDTNLPVYQIAGDVFLVDDSGGNVRVRHLPGQQVTSDMVAAVLESQATNLVALINQVQDAEFDRQFAMAFGMDDSAGGFDGNGGDGGGSSDNSLVADLGTNLWIIQTAVANGSLTGIATNTFADVTYEIQSRTNLLQTDWQSEGLILGSEATNWTPLYVLQNGRQTLFIRLKSWASSDGSDIPDWWELEYFGATGVDPNAQDGAGDGWTIYQKYQMNLNPNVFYTPPAPQVTAYLNASYLGTVSWLPSLGAVTGYTVEKDDFVLGTTTNYTFSTNTLSFQDDLSEDFDIDNLALDGDGPDDSFTTYTVTANYASGNSSPATVNLPNTGISQFFPILNAGLVVGANGRLYFAFQGLPSDLQTIRICRIENGNPAVYSSYDDAYLMNGVYSTFTNGYFEIPASAITNGVCQVPDSQTAPYFQENFAAQILRSNGVSSAWSSFNSLYSQTTVASLPFVDLRRQMKDSLSFILRASSQWRPFEFSMTPYPLQDVYFAMTNCACESIYGSYGYQTALDVFKPVDDNCMFRNFVFDQNYLNTDGTLNTGANPSGNFFYSDPALTVTNFPYYHFYFDLPDFITGSNPNVPTSLLDASQTRWILEDDLGTAPITDTSFPTGQRNFYGLPYLSAEITYATNNQVYLQTLYPGDATPSYFGYDRVFFEVAQPGYQLANYYFARVGTDPQPEMSSFATTNVTPAMFLGVGSNLSIAGYEKLAVTNSASGTYAYLGQYFDHAYAVDDSGNVTSTNTGVLSPYGNFFATAPGQAALVTMPDIDNTEQRGTDMVYCVSVALDGNHDGTIDTSFTGQDSTSPLNPYVFWADNNYDRYVNDADDGVPYDDDVKTQDSPGTPDHDTPDCNYLDGAGHRVIPCSRDLQDFARIWVCGINSNLLANLPAGSTVTLNWGDVVYPNSANPTIDIFQAADTDGGIGYLTNSITGFIQTENTLCPYIGRLGPGSNLVLNASQFANNWAGNHFIWCGVNYGSGGLNLTIADASGNVLAQSTAYIKIVDIKQMYERWTVGDIPSNAPATVASLATDGLPAGVPAFRYVTTNVPTATTPYILYVHGWNMEMWEKDRFAESAFKRLYWQGYQGRFGSFRWPTYFGFTGSFWQALTDTRNFDNSEFIAWQSAQGLLAKLYDLKAIYTNNVYLLAHSMGNVVVGEALRLAGSNQVANAYIASQAAISAHAYDSTLTNALQFTYTYPSGALNSLGSQNYGPDTPDIYVKFMTGNSGGVGRRINFYNENDFALAMPRWGFDQITKPDFIPPNTQYTYNWGDPGAYSAPWNSFYTYPYVGGGYTHVDIVSNILNHYRVFAYAAESRSTALGATPGVTNMFNLDLQTIWPPDTNPAFQNNPYSEHFYHSAEFRGDYWEQQSYWNQVLGNNGFNLK